MKEILATRKVKDAIVDHFRNGGTAANLPGDLARVNPCVVAQCQEFFAAHRKAKKKRHADQVDPA